MLMINLQNERKSKLFRNPWPPEFFNPNCPCCGVGDGVLVWLDPNDCDFSDGNNTYTELIRSFNAFPWRSPQVYVGPGISQDPDYDISPYRLIFFPMPVSDPVWWDDATGENATWKGRLVLIGEWGSDDPLVIGGDTFGDINNYIASKQSLTGISYHLNSIRPGCGSVGNATSDTLMDGIEGEEINIALSSSVTGGTALVTASGHTICARNKPSGSNVEYVVCGDNNMFDDTCGTVSLITSPYLTNTTLFAHNLYDIPL